MSNSLLEKMLKNSTVKQTEVLATSKFFKNRGFAPTKVPAINAALSGSLDGGLTCGVTVLAGPSRHFKTSFSLVMAKGYMDTYPDSVLLFYDSEFGSPQGYFSSFGIDTNRVLHTPVTDLEELKHDVMVQLKELSDKDQVIIIVDSIGNLASKKEVDDAVDGKNVADMTRAKSVKSFFRMVTPHLTMKNIPLVVINHIYMCGTEDMLVTTEGGVKSLKDIVVGDVVLTTNGFEPVTNTFKFEDAYVTDIELEDGTTLSFTGGHRFMVNGEWVFVDDLKVGMELDTQ